MNREKSTNSVRKQIRYGDITSVSLKPTESQLKLIADIRKYLSENGVNHEIIREPTTRKEAHYAIVSLQKLRKKYWNESAAKEAIQAQKNR